MKKKYIRKIIIATTAVAFTAATLVSTTYAWLNLSYVSEISQFEFEALGANGLQISLDGVNFSQDINVASIKEKIANNRGVEYATEYHAVTLKQDTNGKVMFDSNGKPEFVKDTTKNITQEVNRKRTQYEIDNEIYYEHMMVDAQTSDYLTFDVWFRIVNDGTVTQDLDLYFTDTKLDNGKKIGFDSTKTTVRLNNNLVTSNGTEYGPEKQNKSIDVKASDAMRLGVVNHTDAKFTVYEESVGLGSSAIEGSTEDIHNPSKNAMYTYYNNLYLGRQFQQAATNGEGFNTVSSYQAKPIHTFKYNQNTKTYSDVKLTIVAWLEGWDADYFAGIQNDLEFSPRNISINLSFEAKTEA